MYSSGKTSYPKEDAFLGEDRRYYRATGTSFATPIVTGIASLLLANNPGLAPADLRRVLEQSARDVETPGRDRFTGYGIVDAEAALAADPAFFIEAGISLVQPVESYGQSLVQLIGTADADQFASAVLQVGEGESPQTWMQVGLPIIDGVVGGQLGQIPIEQLANSTTWTIRVLVTHESGAVREARYVIDL